MRCPTEGYRSRAHALSVARVAATDARRLAHDYPYKRRWALDLYRDALTAARAFRLRTGCGRRMMWALPGLRGDSVGHFVRNCGAGWPLCGDALWLFPSAD